MEQINGEESSRGEVTLPPISVVVCPDPFCTRTATIETDSNVQSVTRFHRLGKKEDMTAELVRLGFVSSARCPHHEISEREAARQLRIMRVEVALEDNRSRLEILDSLLLADFKSQKRNQT